MIKIIKRNPKIKIYNNIMENNFDKIQKKIGIKFDDLKLLQQVFVHRSYLNEHKDFKLDHNERLEFLGDAVLELIVTEYLYKHYNEPEGILTNWRSALVRGESLSALAEKLDIDKYLLLSHGESKSSGKGRKLILANALEALVGAIYLDKGYEKTCSFIEKFLIINLDDIIKKGLYIDAKSKLQELAQDKYTITPRYQVTSEFGPDHDKNFIIAVFLDDKKIGEGNGSSKQLAEQDAAKNALRNLISTNNNIF